MSVLKARAAARRKLNVFVSYSTKNLPAVQRVRDALTAVGANAFVAEYSVPPGNSLIADISAAIDRSDVIVLLWSKDAADSTWVRNEVRRASAQQKRMIVFKLEREASLPTFLSDLKYIPAHEDLEGGIDLLVSRVRELFTEKQRGIADSQSEAAVILIGAMLLLAAFNTKN